MGSGVGQGGNPPAAVEQGEKQHQSDQDVIPAGVRKNGATCEDGATDPGEAVHALFGTRFVNSAWL